MFQRCGFDDFKECDVLLNYYQAALRRNSFFVLFSRRGFCSAQFPGNKTSSIMNKHLTLLFGTALTSLMLSTPVYAFNSYVSGNVGWSASSDLDINNNNGSLLVKVPLQAGTNFQGAVGSRFENIRIEGELGYQRKPVDLPGVSGSSKIISLLANGYFDLATEGIQPYVTGGVGVGWESFTDFVAGGYPLILSGGVTKLAYQLGFGVAIPVVKNIAIDARYRHFTMGEINEGNLIKYTPSTTSFLIGVRIGI